MRGERFKFGMQFWIVPVRPIDSRFEIVDYQPAGHATKVIKCFFDGRDEVACRLQIDDIAVRFSAAA